MRSTPVLMSAVATLESRLQRAEPIQKADAPQPVPGAPADSIVVANRIVKRYKDVEALRGVSLTVRGGEVFGLLGPNGAGKTTLVEILEGIRQPTAGTVRVLGMDPATEARPLRERLGVCLQHTSMPRYIRVREAVALFGAMYPRRRMSPAELLDRFHLTQKRDAYFGNLSGGQRQRLALALAVLHDPVLLILDEPSAGLDPQARLDIQDLIQELRNEQKSILLTTHYLEEAEKLCDRVAIIDHGEILVQGTPKDVCCGSTLPSRMCVTLSAAVPERLVQSLKGTSVKVEDGARRLVIETRDPGSCTVEIARWLIASGHQIRTIEITNPSLERVFVELTGGSVRS
jgi:ABC-2 type transport system ATP-binding protein